MENNRLKSIVRFVEDFNIIRRSQQWSDEHLKKSKFNRLKLEYAHSRTDHIDLFTEDIFNTLKIKD